VGGSSSGGGDQTKTKRYAPYIEAQHVEFLTITATRRDDIISDSPFIGYSSIEISDAFFGLGYLISSFPNLQDMFGKHMAGLDIETLWDSTFNGIVNSSEVDEVMVEEIKLLDEEIERELADYQVSMRNLNAISTSSFILGKAVVEDKRVKAFAKISLDNKIELFSTIGKEYTTRLDWEKGDITVYANAMKDYFMYTAIIDNVNAKFVSKNSLWPFTVLSFEEAALGTMQSVVSWQKKTEPRERSDVSKGLLVASYTTTGYMIGGPWGAAVGAIVGIGMMLLE